MKAIITFLFMACFVANAQKITDRSGVITIDSLNKTEIYIAAKLWIANTYKSSKAVLDMDDKESGNIVVKGVVIAKMPVSFAGYTRDCEIEHTVSIRIKDGKYKYEIAGYKARYYNDDGFNSGWKPVDIYAEDFAGVGKKNEANFRKNIIAQLDVIEQSLIAAISKAQKDDF